MWSQLVVPWWEWGWGGVQCGWEAVLGAFLGSVEMILLDAVLLFAVYLCWWD